MPRPGDQGVHGADVERRLGPRVPASADERQALLERLSRIQRSISAGAPLQEVLDAIAAGAAELLGEDVIALRLLDPSGPGRVYIAASVGLTEEEKLTVRNSAIGEGAGGRAILEDRLVVIEDYARADGTIPHFAREGLQAAMAAPVRDGATVVGSLVVASYRAARRYSQAERAMLLAFADHTGLAIADARTRTLAGQVAHDFNNLLGVILGSARFALESLGDEHPARAEIARIEEAALHGDALTSQLLAFTRRATGAAEIVIAGAIVRSAVALAQRSVPEGVTLRAELGEVALNIRIDPTELRQVVLNLLDNAFGATPAGGEVVVAVREREPAQASLLVRDTGTGMPPEVAARALEPMFTTKPRGEGTGFGLAIVGQVAQDAGGSVELRSTPGRGTEVEVLFPLATEPVAAAPGRGEAILVVEDDPGVRDLTRRLLGDEGFSVVEAAGAEEALACDAERAFDLVLTDNTMPGMHGTELLGALRCVRAGTPAIIMSGWVDESEPAGAGGSVSWLQKPFGAAELLDAVRGALRARRGAQSGAGGAPERTGRPDDHT